MQKEQSAVQLGWELGQLGESLVKTMPDEVVLPLYSKMLENHPKGYLTMKTTIEYKDGKWYYALIYSLTTTLNKYGNEKRERRL